MSGESRVSWLELSVTVPRELEATASEALEGLGAQAVTSADAGDEPVLEPAPGETPLWPQVQLTGLFDGDADGSLLGALLDQRLEGRGTAISCRRLGDRDWARSWLDDFKPMHFGGGLWVCPGHLAPPAEAETVVTLDPGLAFGTGTHPTTALCLEWLASSPPRGLTVLDFGCGSGILALAALKLDAARALCVDNDPQALEATRSNAQRNQVLDRLELLTSHALAPACADVTVANILAGPLVELEPLLSRVTRPGGKLVLSGLLASQRELVENAYGESFSDFGISERDGWLRITATRRAR